MYLRLYNSQLKKKQTNKQTNEQCNLNKTFDFTMITTKATSFTYLLHNKILFPSKKIESEMFGKLLSDHIYLKTKIGQFYPRLGDATNTL